ncbi:MAG: enoyl-[acyl-carrier-protein] reductase FabI [Dehalococcoidia bacterium]|nr:enoyl-[acyl-carrier-protein] reductase FabI [Dehalococcoidia bacterium]
MDFKGKKGLIFGVANHRSIAYYIAKELSSLGAEIGYSYQNERILGSVEKSLNDLNPSFIEECDVLNQNSLDNFFKVAKVKLNQIDFIVHSIAFAEREDLGGNFSNVTKDGFSTALETSAYSLIPITKLGSEIMNPEGGSIITLSFEASQKVYPGYNIMGTAKAALENCVKQLASEYGKNNIRVNAVSAGPLPTLAARSIAGFKEMQKVHSDRSPLKRNVTHEEVANTSSFLLSDLSSGITGAIIPVDSGYGIMGL